MSKQLMKAKQTNKVFAQQIQMTQEDEDEAIEKKKG